MYIVIVAWLEVGENLGIAVFMVTSSSRKVLIVCLPEVRSGSRRVGTYLLVWQAQGLVVDFPSFEA